MGQRVLGIGFHGGALDALGFGEGLLQALAVVARHSLEVATPTRRHALHAGSVDARGGAGAHRGGFRAIGRGHCYRSFFSSDRPAGGPAAAAARQANTRSGRWGSQTSGT